jgi:hypothetical protein
LKISSPSCWFSAIFVQKATLAGILNGTVLAETTTHEHLSKLLKGAEKNESLSCENMKACFEYICAVD